jgi:hypothetical protein
MFSVLLQCQRSGIGLGVTSFNVSNIVTTKAFQHLFAIMNENWEAFLQTTKLPYISIECKVAQSEINSWIGEINTIMVMRVTFWSRGVDFAFVWQIQIPLQPSKCNILNVYEEPRVNLAIVVAICNGS